jgi:transposase
VFIRNREELEHEVVMQHVQGWTIRALTRHWQLGRNTIRRILRKHLARREQGHDLLIPQAPRTPRESKLDPFVPRIKLLLEQYPKITGQRMYEQLREAGYTGKRTILLERLRTLRPQPKRDPVVRFETAPGEQGQMDWSPYTLVFRRTGKVTVNCFSYILGFSRRQFIDFVRERDHFTLIRRHRDAFEYYGGVPHHCLYDSEKTVVLRWEANRPVYNPAFVAFITHYHCRPVACRRGRPQTKGKIERPFQYVEGNLLNARTFDDLEDLRTMARWWMANRSDPHTHDTTGRPPLELFLEQEQQHLRPLPAHPYDCAQVALRVCSLDGWVEFQTNLYSVPYEYVVDILALKATEHEVIVYSQELEQVAVHERLPKGAGRKAEIPAHRVAKKLRYGLEPVREAFLELGEHAKAFLTGLQDKFPRNPGFHARAILQLKEHYHCEDIHRALAHACRYQAFDAKAIERILKARARPRTLESIRTEQAREHLQETLPPVRQRSLEEYALLLGDTHDESSREGAPHEHGPGSDPDETETPETVCPGEGHRPGTGTRREGQS